MPFQFQTEYPPGTIGNACYLCNLSRREDDRIIDPFKHVDFEGYVMFCETCIREVARFIGCLTPEDAASLRAEHTLASHAVLELQGQLADREELVRLLQSANSYLAAESPTVEPPMPTDVPAPRTRAKTHA